MASVQFIKITTNQCTQIIPNRFKILKENLKLFQYQLKLDNSPCNARNKLSKCFNVNFVYTHE